MYNASWCIMRMATLKLKGPKNLWSLVYCAPRLQGPPIVDFSWLWCAISLFAPWPRGSSNVCWPIWEGQLRSIGQLGGVDERRHWEKPCRSQKSSHFEMRKKTLRRKTSLCQHWSILRTPSLSRKIEEKNAHYTRDITVLSFDIPE